MYWPPIGCYEVPRPLATFLAPQKTPSLGAADVTLAVGGAWKARSAVFVAACCGLVGRAQSAQAKAKKGGAKAAHASSLTWCTAWEELISRQLIAPLGCVPAATASSTPGGGQRPFGVDTGHIHPRLRRLPALWDPSLLGYGIANAEVGRAWIRETLNPILVHYAAPQVLLCNGMSG